MPKKSSGILMYRLSQNQLEVFLAHPGGPYFTNRDRGYWGIPKGLIELGENYLAAAQREFTEETGIEVSGPFISLGKVKYSSSRKIVHAWACQGEWNPSNGIKSNSFSVEWPPKSGNQQQFPEIDRAAWFDLNTAKSYIHPAQLPLLTRLSDHLLAV